MPIKAIVFDLGKVLLDFDYGIAAAKIAARCTSLPVDVFSFVAQSPLLFRYETGLLSKAEFYQAICAHTGYCGDLEEFSGYFSDIFSEIRPMVELQRSLRAKGYPTYIFSNTNDLAITHIRANFPFFANFDGYILSYEHGAMKPDHQLYAVVEKQSGHKGKELLYLDDRAENIATGAERGWEVILQESPERTLAKVKELGLLG